MGPRIWVLAGLIFVTLMALEGGKGRQSPLSDTDRSWGKARQLLLVLVVGKDGEDKPACSTNSKH